MFDQMKSYQTLSLIGGVLGLLIVFAAFIVMGIASSMSENFGGAPVKGKDQVMAQIGISILLYIIAIIIPFTIKKTKPLGYVLIGLGITSFISAGYFGIVGFALLVAGGIAAIKYQGKDNKNSIVDALEILKSRYAKGEITKDEYERMKQDLG